MAMYYVYILSSKYGGLCMSKGLHELASEILKKEYEEVGIEIKDVTDFDAQVEELVYQYRYGRIYNSAYTKLTEQFKKNA